MPHNKNLNYQPFQVIENHDSRVLLLCDHASNYIPDIYNNLNISDEATRYELISQSIDSKV